MANTPESGASWSTQFFLSAATAEGADPLFLHVLSALFGHGQVTAM